MVRLIHSCLCQNNMCLLGFAGFDIQLSERNESINIKPYVICFSGDLPARAAVQNMIQFNGFYGCSFCEQPGETVHTSARGHVHAFAFSPEDPSGPPREHDKLIMQAELALQINEPVRVFHYDFTLHD